MRVRGAMFGLVLALGSLPAHAAMVVYEWVPGAGFTGTGTMTFDLGSSTDGLNFAVPAASLVSFAFDFANPATPLVTLANLNAISVATNTWTASGGYLTTVATLNDTTVPRFSFHLQAYLASSPNPLGSRATSLDPPFFEDSFGVWRYASTVSPVPLPAAGWLLGAGLVGFAGALRRRRAVAVR